MKNQKIPNKTNFKSQNLNFKNNKTKVRIVVMHNKQFTSNNEGKTDNFIGKKIFATYFVVAGKDVIKLSNKLLKVTENG